MASLQHADALRLPAALLMLSLLAACGGDRSRPAGGGDTTGTAVVIPDSAAMPVTDTTLPAPRDSAQSAAPSAASDTGVKSASAPPAAKPPSTRAPAEVPTAVAKAPAKAPAATPRRPAPPADTGAAPSAPPPASAEQMAVADARTAQDSGAAPAPAPAQQQDTSKATTGSAGAPLRDDYHQAPRDTVSQAVYNGWKQFNLNCARCHGEDVLGTTIAPHLIVSLKPGGPVGTKESFVQTVCAGRPEKGMPGWCALGLEMDKISDMYEYVKSRSDAKVGPGRPAVREG